VQIAKAFGAEVAGVCGTRNVDMVRSIGADHVIDYTQEDFTQGGQRYDFILDNVAKVSMFVRRQGRPSVKFPNRKDLVVLKGLIESGKVTPVIDGTYPLSEAPEAIGHVGKGHARGSVVITVLGTTPNVRAAPDR
jgi:NADPH:quinone reductase-like Zn-dependent oxidoreductase